ncbi:MAG: DUF3592 domain-containing protein [Lachnospiraceae bacterium]|nr:DUF3592 domain-containing protein [Lachnospiraceae bacterium]
MLNEDEEVGIGRNNPVIGITFLAWFIGSIAVLFLAAKGSLPLFMIPIGLGQFFLGFVGIIGVSIVKMLRQHKVQPWGPVAFTILLLISIGLIAVGFLQMGGMVEHILSDLPRLVCGRPLENDGLFYAALFLGMFFLAALGLVLECVVYQMIRKKHCTVPVTGTCIEMKSRWNRDANHPSERIVEAPVFQYEYRSTLYKSCDEIYTSTNKVKEGNQVQLYINPKYPEEFYVEGTGIFHKNLIIGSGILTVLSLAGVILCCVNM